MAFLLNRKIAPLANAKSIAVLPFETRSEDKANAYFANGVHDHLLTSLTNIRDLQVTSRTSVMECRNTTKKIPQIARELGVAWMPEGSVQRSGNSVRITGQLIRAATDQHVWARNFDRELTAANLFAIQTELAQAIAGELRAVLSPQEQKQLETRPTTSVAAYDLFLKAREFRERQNTTAAIVEAEKLLTQAVEIDPQFGLAWAKLAWVRVYITTRSGTAQGQWVHKAREALGPAEKLIPETPEFLLSRGYVF